MASDWTEYCPECDATVGMGHSLWHTERDMRMRDCEENADYLHQEKMDNMCESEHALYRKKGKAATIEWTNCSLPDMDGRVVGEKFYYQSNVDGYHSLHITSVQEGQYLLILGGSRVLGEILLEEEESDDE
jgi:hypothetical protein